MARFGLLFISLISSGLNAAPTGSYGSCGTGTENAPHLIIRQTQIEIEGKSSEVFEVVTEDGSPILKRKKGECFNLVVENESSFLTCLHWHGLVLPVLEDGVPYLTQFPILPGKTYPYNFPVVQSGSFFGHSHYGLQEVRLMGLPIILTDQDVEDVSDVVLFFEDFAFKMPEVMWQELRKEYSSIAKIKGTNWIPPFAPPPQKHAPIDMNDVAFDAYLTNRKTLENAEIITVRPGERVRVRLINGSSSSNFHVSLGDLETTIIAVDGNPVSSLSHAEFPLATAQRVDVMVTIPKEGGAFPILAQAQGTDKITGVLLKTEGARGPVLSSKAKKVIGPITNNIEKELAAVSPLQEKQINKELLVELEGNMKYYVWALNNQVWPNNQPLMVKEGDRVQMTFVNKTSMSHPMHLHGHTFQVVEIDGDIFPGAMRDTVLVMPGQTVKVIFDANNPGIWALHCHIAFHQWAGMFTVVQYEGYTPPYFPMKDIYNYSRLYGGY